MLLIYLRTRHYECGSPSTLPGHHLGSAHISVSVHFHSQLVIRFARKLTESVPQPCGIHISKANIISSTALQVPSLYIPTMPPVWPLSMDTPHNGFSV